jgi:hypothetical protein
VKPAQHVAIRTGMIVLDKAVGNAELREVGLAVTFKEKSPLIGEDFGLGDQHVLNLKMNNLRVGGPGSPE